MSDPNGENERWLIGTLDPYWDENSTLTARIVLKIFVYYLEMEKNLPFASGKKVYDVISNFARGNSIDIPTKQAIIKKIIQLYSEWSGLKKLRHSESPTQRDNRALLEKKLDDEFVFKKSLAYKPPKIKKKKRAPLLRSPEILTYKRPVLLKRVII